MFGEIIIGLLIGFVLVFLIYTAEYFIELWIFGRDLEFKFTNKSSEESNPLFNGRPSSGRNENTCIFCFASIPEGDWVCKSCKDKMLKG